MTREPVPVDLSGVSATLLSNLARRAAAARAKNPLLDDPFAVEVVEWLDYDFTDVSSRGVSWHAVRVATFDGAVRRFLKRHPDGTVVALGEGLETQFWRVDNGRMRWLTVDLPPVLDLRRRVLPVEPRQQSYSGSVLVVLPRYAATGVPVIISVGGLSIDDYARAAAELAEVDCAAFEVNVSCPNLEEGGLEIGSCRNRWQPSSSASSLRQAGR